MKQEYTGNAHLFYTCPYRIDRGFYDAIWYKPFYSTRLKQGWIVNDKRYYDHLAGLRLARLERLGYKFRHGPVPNVHKYSAGGCNSHNRGKNLKKEYAQTIESCKYDRAKRKSLVHYLIGWDGISKSYDSEKSWKSKKMKKQWMAHVGR